MYIKLHSKDVMDAMEDVMDAMEDAKVAIEFPTIHYADRIHWSDSIASLDFDAWHEVKEISDGYFMVATATGGEDPGSLFWIPPWAVEAVKEVI